MIHLDLQPELEAQLAAEAKAHGAALDRYIEKIVEAYASEGIEARIEGHSVADAIDRILKLREGTSLGALSFKDLINEGRKY